ncbi:MAG: peptidase M50, partial [Acidobacteria bacterium]
MSTGDITRPTTEASPRPLRLWPGIIAVVLLLLFRFAVKAVVPGLQGFMWAIEGTLGCAVAIIL